MITEPFDYEATIAAVETAIERIEAGELSLEEVFTCFEAAVGQLKDCEAFLQRGKARLALAVETLSDESEDDERAAELSQ